MIMTPRVFGGLKVIGGGAEFLAGVAGVATPEPVTSTFGVVAVVHGMDTAQSGLRQLSSGQDTDTFFSEGLQLTGVERHNANLLDAGLGFVASGGTTLALRGSSSGTRALKSVNNINLADDVPSVSIAYKPNTGAVNIAGTEVNVGHNMVGVNTGAGTQWSELVIAEGEAIVVSTSLREGYSVANVPVSVARAEAAAANATRQTTLGSAGAYTVCATDCATYASGVLRSASVNTPRLTTPSVNYGAVLLQTPEAGQITGAVAASGYGIEAQQSLSEP